MNPILRKMTAGVFALGLVATGLFAAPHPVAAASMGLSVSGGLSHSIGDTITLTPTGTYGTNPTGIAGCQYVLVIRQPLAPRSSYAVSAQVISNSLKNPDGTCQSWTFTLPRLDQMVYLRAGQSDTVDVSVSSYDGTTSFASSTYTINFAASDAQPVPASSQPAIFWTLSDTAPAIGASVTISPIVVGPSEFLTTASFFFCSATLTPMFGSQITPYSQASSCPDISFTQVEPGMNAWLQAGLNPLFGGTTSTLFVQDPPSVDPTPGPTVAPTPEPSATPTPESSATPTPESSATPTPESSVSPISTATPTPEPTSAPVVTPTPQPTVKPTVTPKPTVKPVVTPKPTVKPVVAPKITAQPTAQPARSHSPMAATSTDPVGSGDSPTPSSALLLGLGLVLIFVGSFMFLSGRRRQQDRAVKP